MFVFPSKNAYFMSFPKNIYHRNVTTSFVFVNIIWTKPFGFSGGGLILLSIFKFMFKFKFHYSRGQAPPPLSPPISWSFLSPRGTYAPILQYTHRCFSFHLFCILSEVGGCQVYSEIGWLDPFLGLDLDYLQSLH